jgi:hypothetical protein
MLSFDHSAKELSHVGPATKKLCNLFIDVDCRITTPDCESFPAGVLGLEHEFELAWKPDGDIVRMRVAGLPWRSESITDSLKTIARSTMPSPRL